jgi:HSP20 family molecular chaperone IbpA
MPEKKPSASKQSAATAEADLDAARIDQLIDSIESVYQSLTGAPPLPPSTASTGAIPVRDPVEFLGEQLDRLRLALQPEAPSSPTRLWAPPLSVWESDSELVLRLDVAGTQREDLTVRAAGNLIVVRGKLPPPQRSEPDLELRASERPLGPFERRIRLPSRVEGVMPQARLEKGELELRFAKATNEKQPLREVEIT